MAVKVGGQKKVGAEEQRDKGMKREVINRQGCRWYGAMKLNGMIPTECMGMQQERKTKQYQNDKKQKVKFSKFAISIGHKQAEISCLGKKNGAVKKQPKKLQ